MTSVLRDVDAVIFDFDGVLVESVDIKTSAFARLFEPYGQDIVARVVAHHRSHGGVSRFEKLRYYYREFLKQPLTDEALEALSRSFADLVVDAVTAAPFVPGAERFLAGLSRRLPCFVVSATPQDEIREIVRRRDMTACFREVLGSPATKAASVKSIIARHRLTAPRVMFFGDAEVDWSAACDAGTRFVGVVSGDDHPLARHDGFQKIADFTELQLE